MLRKGLNLSFLLSRVILQGGPHIARGLWKWGLLAVIDGMSASPHFMGFLGHGRNDIRVKCLWRVTTRMLINRKHHNQAKTEITSIITPQIITCMIYMIFLHDTAIIPISQNIVVVVGVGQHFPIGWWKAMRKTHWRGALGSSGESPECFRWDTCEGLGTFVGPPSKWSFLDAHRFCLYRFRQGGAQPLCRVPIQLNLHSLPKWPSAAHWAIFVNCAMENVRLDLNRKIATLKEDFK